MGLKSTKGRLLRWNSAFFYLIDSMLRAKLTQPSEQGLVVTCSPVCPRL